MVKVSGTGSAGQLRVGEMRGREGYAEEGGRRERGRWKRAKRRKGQEGEKLNWKEGRGKVKAGGRAEGGAEARR